MAINEIRWQDIFVEKVHEFEKVLPIYRWCLESWGKEVPASAYTWFRVVFSAGEPGGWTNSWRDSGFSLIHMNSKVIEDIKEDAGSYPDLLKRFPLYVLFYSQEAVTEFRLTWQ
jgi:hypothetical protein